MVRGAVTNATKLTDKTLPTALAFLAEACPRMKSALERCGPPPIRRRAGGFPGLLRILTGQQVSVAAGDAIFAKLEAAGAVAPEVVLAMAEDDLRALGLSRPKARYAKAIAEAVNSGALCFKRQSAAPLEEAVAEMTAIKGVGPWTAEIYQMFCVGRPDLLPVGDLALREAAGRLYDLPERPTQAEFAALGEPWSPWRSAAALVLWRFYAAEKSKEGVL